MSTEQNAKDIIVSVLGEFYPDLSTITHEYAANRIYDCLAEVDIIPEEKPVRGTLLETMTFNSIFDYAASAYVISEGRVTVNNAIVKDHSRKVHQGDVIEYRTSSNSRRKFKVA